MTIKELIEQIGGRDRLLEIIVTGPDASGAEQNLMARALLAVLDAKENPSAWIINCNSARINFAETEKTSVDKIIEECRENGTDIDITPLYTTPPAASAPDGWKLVPLEPTQRMIEAHIEGMVSGGATRAYRAMIAAAPAPGGDDVKQG